MFNYDLTEISTVWIDSDNVEEICTKIQRAEQPRKSEEFIKRVATSLEIVLQDEIFIVPNKEAQVPLKFVVYLNPTDNLLWQGAKRTALEKSLGELVYSRAVALAENTPLFANSIQVELKYDKSLAHPMFHVVAFWSDSEIRSSLHEVRETSYETFGESPIIDSTFLKPSTFKVKIWKNAMFQNELSLYKNYAVIGRNSVNSIVDIPLNEPFVSRIQAQITFEGGTKFFLTNEGVNPIAVNNRIVPSQTSAVFNSMEAVTIGDYTLMFFADEYDFVPLPPPFSDVYAMTAN